MQLDAVESSGNRELGRVGVLLDRRANFGFGHRLGRRRVDVAVRVDPKGRAERDGARRDDLGAGRHVLHVRGASAVHELREDAPALFVDGARDLAPALDLRVVEEAGNTRVAETIFAGRDALGDDEPSARALTVIGRHQVIGHVAERAIAGHRRHDDAVLKGRRTEGIGRKQAAHGQLRRKDEGGRALGSEALTSVWNIRRARPTSTNRKRKRGDAASVCPPCGRCRSRWMRCRHSHDPRHGWTVRRIRFARRG